MSEQSQPQLLPCPFCGHTVKEIFFTEDYYAFVLCRNCGAHGPEQLTQEVTGSVKEVVSIKWNTRHNHTSVQQDCKCCGKKCYQPVCSDCQRLIKQQTKGGDIEMRNSCTCDTAQPGHLDPGCPQHGVQYNNSLTSPEQPKEPSRGEVKTILIKCFEHLVKEIERKTLNESAKDGTQSLSKELATILDKL